MRSNTKAILISIVVFLMIFLGVHTLLSIYFGIKNPLILGVTSAVAASLLSPRRVVVQNQSGKEIQLKWFFSKKKIRFK